MAEIDGINMAIYQCSCNGAKMWIFRGQNGEGYKIACVKCSKDQRELIDEMGIKYLWKHREEGANEC